MRKSRKKTILTCLECGITIHGGSHMSRHVKESHDYNSYDEYKIKYNLIKNKTLLKHEGAISCGICNLLSHDLTSHILRTHKIEIPKYKEIYGEIRSEKYLLEQSNRIKGNKNPAYNHQGKFSPLSDKFIYADIIDKEKISLKISNSNKNNGNNSTTIKYWINLGYTEQESKNKISERQKTFTLEKCIEKYGDQLGKEKWLERQEKWQNSCKKTRRNGFSKISQKLFWEIYDNLVEEKEFIFFAELGEDKCLDDSGVNNEYTLKLSGRILLPDFINIKNKKIIEFDGTYWHGKNIIKSPNRLRDEERDLILIENDYKVIHIKEKDYMDNKNKIIKECLEFLNV
jgi:hypothetical protein